MSDEDAGITQIQCTIDVENAVPDVTITALVAETFVSVNRAIAFAGAFSNAGVRDTHTATWSFHRVGSDEVEDVPATIEESGEHGTARITKTFSTPGLDSFKLSVTDNNHG